MIYRMWDFTPKRSITGSLNFSPKIIGPHSKMVLRPLHFLCIVKLNNTKMRRLTALLGVMVFILAGCTGNNSKESDMRTNGIFPKGEVITGANAANFDGTAYLQMLMTDAENFDCTMANVTFDPGCRNSWHSHPGGQLLIVVSGEGYYQEEGGPIQIIKSGDVIAIKPDVVHWHGATPGSPMEHIAISTRIHLGPAVWSSPVTDEQYNSYKK